MYGDALISAAIIMFILPVVLSIFWMATLTVYRAYYWDHILQDTITYLEVAKASYYKNGAIETGVYNSQFYDTFASDFGVAAMLPHPVSKRESGERPELYP